MTLCYTFAPPGRSGPSSFKLRDGLRSRPTKNPYYAYKLIPTKLIPTKIIPTKLIPLRFSLLSLSLPRFVDSESPGSSLRTWELHPLRLRFCLSQTLWSPESVRRLAVAICAQVLVSRLSACDIGFEFGESGRRGSRGKQRGETIHMGIRL